MIDSRYLYYSAHKSIFHARTWYTRRSGPYHRPSPERSSRVPHALLPPNREFFSRPSRRERSARHRGERAKKGDGAEEAQKKGKERIYLSARARPYGCRRRQVIIFFRPVTKLPENWTPFSLPLFLSFAPRIRTLRVFLSAPGIIL